MIAQILTQLANRTQKRKILAIASDASLARVTGSVRRGTLSCDSALHIIACRIQLQAWTGVAPRLGRVRLRPT